MVGIRNRLSQVRAGGPRQFTELRDMLLVEADSQENIRETIQELSRIGFRSDEYSAAPIVRAEPQETMANVLQRAQDLGLSDNRVSQAIDEISSAVDSDDSFLDASYNTLRATAEVLSTVRNIGPVSNASFVLTEADFGPENLRHSPTDMPTVSGTEASTMEGNMRQLNENLGLTDVWQHERGSNAIVAIFDTGFADSIIGGQRVIDTYHGGGTDSVYAPAEGHGTMCAGAAAANKTEGVPFNGAAPDAGVILVRITDSEGQIRSDITTDAWDWLQGLEYDRPIVTNHSYGTPLCTGRPRAKFCNDPSSDMLRVANSSADICSVFAAGNEAMQCGHRPSGITNAVTGQNSLAEVITVGALRFDGREAQRYSSHGRGDCAPVADPKPNVSCALPNQCYYGTADGWKMKDMSIGYGGSSGGTSHASPTTTGMVALLQSASMKENGEPLHTEELKSILHDTATLPHKSHISAVGKLMGRGGYDARFGHGQVSISDALEEV